MGAVGGACTHTCENTGGMADHATDDHATDAHTTHTHGRTRRGCGGWVQWGGGAVGWGSGQGACTHTGAYAYATRVDYFIAGAPLPVLQVGVGHVLFVFLIMHRSAQRSGGAHAAIQRRHGTVPRIVDPHWGGIPSALRRPRDRLHATEGVNWGCARAGLRRRKRASSVINPRHVEPRGRSKPTKFRRLCGQLRRVHSPAPSGHVRAQQPTPPHRAPPPHLCCVSSIVAGGLLAGAARAPPTRRKALPGRPAALRAPPPPPGPTRQDCPCRPCVVKVFGAWLVRGWARG